MLQIAYTTEVVLPCVVSDLSCVCSSGSFVCAYADVYCGQDDVLYCICHFFPVG